MSTFPKRAIKLRWSFDDASAFTGRNAEIKNRVRVISDQIRLRIERFILEVSLNRARQ